MVKSALAPNKYSLRRAWSVLSTSGVFALGLDLGSVPFSAGRIGRSASVEAGVGGLGEPRLWSRSPAHLTCWILSFLSYKMGVLITVATRLLGWQGGTTEMMDTRHLASGQWTTHSQSCRCPQGLLGQDPSRTRLRERIQQDRPGQGEI